MRADIGSMNSLGKKPMDLSTVDDVNRLLTKKKQRKGWKLFINKQ